MREVKPIGNNSMSNRYLTLLFSRRCTPIKNHTPRYGLGKYYSWSSIYYISQPEEEVRVPLHNKVSIQPISWYKRG